MKRRARGSGIAQSFESLESRRLLSAGQGPGIVPSLSVTDASTAEGNHGKHTVNIHVNLSAPGTQPVTVRFATADGSAQQGGDYAAKKGILTFRPGQISKSISVSVNGDTVLENDETFGLNLSSPKNATIQTGSSIVTITNDDSATAAKPLIVVVDAIVSEANDGQAVCVYPVALSATTNHDVTLRYRSVDGTAKAARDLMSHGDYLKLAGTVTIPAGKTMAQIAVQIVNDSQQEPTRTFKLEFSSAKGAVLAGDISKRDVSVNVLDNDGPTTGQEAVTFGGDWTQGNPPAVLDQAGVVTFLNRVNVALLSGGTVVNQAGITMVYPPSPIGGTLLVSNTGGAMLGIADGIITGTASITKSGSGWLTLNGSTNDTGSTSINSGTSGESQLDTISGSTMVINYQGSSPLSAIREMIANARGPAGLGNATGNGLGGITSSTSGGQLAVNNNDNALSGAVFTTGSGSLKLRGVDYINTGIQSGLTVAGGTLSLYNPGGAQSGGSDAVATLTPSSPPDPGTPTPGSTDSTGSTAPGALPPPADISSSSTGSDTTPPPSDSAGTDPGPTGTGDTDTTGSTSTDPVSLPVDGSTSSTGSDTTPPPGGSTTTDPGTSTTGTTDSTGSTPIDPVPTPTDPSSTPPASGTTTTPPASDSTGANSGTTGTGPTGSGGSSPSHPSSNPPIQDPLPSVPFVDVTLLGRLHGTDDVFSDTVSVTAGDAVDYEVLFSLAPVGTHNAAYGGLGQTITALGPKADGINSLNFDIFESSSAPIQANFAAAGAFSNANNAWDVTAAASEGTPTARAGTSSSDLIRVGAYHAPGVFSAVTSEIVLTGTFDISSTGTGDLSQLQMRIDSAGGFKINQGIVIDFASLGTESSSHPMVNFAVLTLQLRPAPAVGTDNTGVTASNPGAPASGDTGGTTTGTGSDGTTPSTDPTAPSSDPVSTDPALTTPTVP